MNKGISTTSTAGGLEVFVRFDEYNEPSHIMGCPEYRDDTGGCSLRAAQLGGVKSYLPCRYSGWDGLLRKKDE